MLYGLVIVIHIVACIILIAVILLQAGRGGGLSETFGSDSSQTIFGTKMSLFLTRATVVAAVSFLVTCLLLGIMTSKRGKSLINMQRVPAAVPAKPAQAVPPVDTKELPPAEPNAPVEAK